MKGLSILIPTYNDECVTLVKDLLAQCIGFFGKTTPFEIIVADDGSTNNCVINANNEIAKLPNCRIILRRKNAGRAAIRNFLVESATYPALLFIDSDMTVIRKDFIRRYVSTWNPARIVYGGYDVPEQSGMESNLRYIYERKCRGAHTAEKRQEHPYKDFHTSNFMVPRAIMTAHPLDECFRNYGYEDVAFGEELRLAGISIRHIDNPMGFCKFEDNKSFINKTEEGLRTLAEFNTKLNGYSRLLTIVEKLDHWHIRKLCQYTLTPIMPILRKNIAGTHPKVALFNLFKLGYLLSVL